MLKEAHGDEVTRNYFANAMSQNSTNKNEHYQPNSRFQKSLACGYINKIDYVQRKEPFMIPNPHFETD